MKVKQIALILVVVGFMVFALSALRQSMTPYVTFAEARARRTNVQVQGVVDHTTVTFDPSGQSMVFSMTDREGTHVRVVYSGQRPGNFDDADTMVVTGRFKGEIFEARKILLKCPSKYEGGGNR